MIKDEFLSMLPESGVLSLTDDQWKLIEKVYSFHPLNFDKQAVANLYVEFGFGIFLDLEGAAQKAMDLEDRTRKSKSLYDVTLKEQNEFLKRWERW